MVCPCEKTHNNCIEFVCCAACRKSPTEGHDNIKLPVLFNNPTDSEQDIPFACRKGMPVYLPGIFNFSVFARGKFTASAFMMNIGLQGHH